VARARRRKGHEALRANEVREKRVVRNYSGPRLRHTTDASVESCRSLFNGLQKPPGCASYMQFTGRRSAPRDRRRVAPHMRLEGAKMAELHYMEMGWSGSGWMDPLPSERPPSPPPASSPSFDFDEPSPSRTKTGTSRPKAARKARKTARKSGRAAKRSARKTARKGKKAARKSGRAAKRSARKTARKGRRTARKAARSTKRSARKSARKSRRSGRRR
jgi:hypothetical protein